ncbi:hypothetical protein [uncultured Cohaesibacter sp.]|uniref:hypothetical protein n=1 Tax=uncultured Cohaesibacter sp. TaxID=1002546 RepID=UPI0029319FCC|nr:hypothetical protein [uncultured Cohaesibacter sp.]
MRFRISVFFVLVILPLSAVDLDFFNKYIGQYKAVEVEKYDVEIFYSNTTLDFTRSFRIEKKIDENYNPDILNIVLDTENYDENLIRITYDDKFFMNISPLSARYYSPEEGEIVITENFTKDTIRFISEDSIELIILWKDKRLPEGISKYSRILYQKILE